MKTRIILGLAFIGLVVGLFCLDHYLSLPYGFLSIGAMILSIASLEASAMGDLPSPHNYGLALLILLLILSIPWHNFENLFSLSILLILLSFFLYPPSPQNLRKLSFALHNFVYIGFLGSFLIQLRFVPQWGETLVIYTLVVSKGTDIFAYFTGSWIGRHKWIPAISPGKTWEGLIGGCLGAGGLGVLLYFLMEGSQIFSWYTVLIFSIILGGISQLGDLAESYLKRSAGVKDSARLLPEFGGMLDLIDSLLFSGTVVFFVWSLTF